MNMWEQRKLFKQRPSYFLDTHVRRTTDVREVHKCYTTECQEREYRALKIMSFLLLKLSISLACHLRSFSNAKKLLLCHLSVHCINYLYLQYCQDCHNTRRFCLFIDIHVITGMPAGPCNFPRDQFKTKFVWAIAQVPSSYHNNPISDVGQESPFWLGQWK